MNKLSPCAPAFDPGGDHRGHSGRPSGAQRVIKAVKRRAPDGSVCVAVRSDIYGGAIIPFVRFTGLHPS